MKNKFKKGFTLVEMLIAVSLFVIVVTISIGALLTVFDANRKAQSSKTVVDNLNLSIENMARIVRFGNYYYCGISPGLSSVNNCLGGGDSLSVTFGGSNRVIYSWDNVNKSIKRSYNGVDEGSITSKETVIEYLKFYVFGTDPSPNMEQPYVVAVIKGYVGVKPTVQTSFSIETMMSQRTLDI